MITILNSDLKKVDILRKYTFAQYTDNFRDIGTFKIIARMVNENLYLLDETEEYYVLFDDNTFGKIENISKNSDSEYDNTITITGRLALVLFAKRIVKGTMQYSGGTTAGYIYQLIYQNIVNVEEEDADRYVNIDIEFDNETYLNTVCSKIDRQVTGGYIWDEIQPVMEQDKLGIYFNPIVEIEHTYDDAQVNISRWNLLISAGVDRTKGNTQGNTPVVFSQSLSNISRTSYDNDITNYRNVAYVAGEGEGEERKWYRIEINKDVNTRKKSGWSRSELWIDARDIQSEGENNEVLSNEEYEELIRRRTDEKAAENTRAVSYDSTVAVSNKLYTYGKDYKKGDFVTIIDDELGITVDAQVTSIVKTIEGSREIVDITFTYGKPKKDPVEQIKNANNLAIENQTNIKYLEQRILESSKNTWKILEHNEINVTEISPGEAITYYIENSDEVKNASEVLIPLYTGEHKGYTQAIHVIRNDVNNSGISIVSAGKGSYILSVSAIVDFLNGKIGFWCGSNTWGFNTLPIKVQSNSIMYIPKSVRTEHISMVEGYEAEEVGKYISEEVLTNMLYYNKPVYRKNIDSAIGASVKVSDFIDDVEDVWLDYTATYFTISDRWVIGNFNNTGSGNTQNYAYAQYDRTNKVLLSSFGDSISGKVHYSVLYTKTTDSPRSQKIMRTRAEIPDEPEEPGTFTEAQIREMFLALHPIGDIIFNVSGENPGNTYGGTWISWGSGRVPIGINESDSDFNEVEKIGGTKAHYHDTGFGYDGNSYYATNVHNTDVILTPSSGSGYALTGGSSTQTP